MKNDYTQDSKGYSREKVLAKAIRLLTVDRNEATCVRKTYVREMYDWFTSQTYDAKSSEVAKKLSPEYIELWEEFHKSYVGYKNAGELKVCYLSGPQPQNDFNVFIKNGIHPHNIWAFESDKATYKNALNCLLNSEYKMLKLHKGSIEQFFQETPKKFDIVYLDFCSTVAGKTNSLRVVSTLLKHQRLNSPGIIITNFSEPDISKETEKNKYIDLMSKYFFSKEYYHDPKGNLINISNNYEELLDYIGENFETFYGQFITRQIFDISSYIIPWMRLINSPYWNRFFDIRPVELFKVITSNKTNNYTLPVDLIENKEGAFENNWLNNLGGMKESSLGVREMIRCNSYTKKCKENYTDSFRKIIEEFSFENEMFQFCDKPNSTLAFDLLTYQLAYPMHYNSKQSYSCSYIAKKNRMYMDMVVLDECRYIYEWLPTIDLVGSALRDVSQQLVYRFALDGLVKQRYWYNNEYFFSGSVLGIYESDKFRDYRIVNREDLNERKEKDTIE